MTPKTFQSPLHVDGKAALSAIYGPWDSVQAAKDFITGEDGLWTELQTGMTIGVIENGAIVEYWNPADKNTFVKKGTDGIGQLQEALEQKADKTADLFLVLSDIVDNASLNMQSTLKGSECEGCSVVYDKTRHTLLLKETLSGVLRPSYYGNWTDADRFGTDSANGRIPFANKIYVCGTSTYRWQDDALVLSSVVSDNDAEIADLSQRIVNAETAAVNAENSAGLAASEAGRVAGVLDSVLALTEVETTSQEAASLTARIEDLDSRKAETADVNAIEEKVLDTRNRLLTGSILDKFPLEYIDGLFWNNNYIQQGNGYYSTKAFTIAAKRKIDVCGKSGNLLKGRIWKQDGSSWTNIREGELSLNFSAETTLLLSFNTVNNSGSNAKWYTDAEELDGLHLKLYRISDLESRVAGCEQNILEDANEGSSNLLDALTGDRLHPHFSDKLFYNGDYLDNAGYMSSAAIKVKPGYKLEVFAPDGTYLKGRINYKSGNNSNWVILPTQVLNYTFSDDSDPGVIYISIDVTNSGESWYSSREDVKGCYIKYTRIKELEERVSNIETSLEEGLDGNGNSMVRGKLPYIDRVYYRWIDGELRELSSSGVKGCEIDVEQYQGCLLHVKLAEKGSWTYAAFLDEDRNVIGDPMQATKPTLLDKTNDVYVPIPRACDYTRFGGTAQKGAKYLRISVPTGIDDDFEIMTRYKSDIFRNVNMLLVGSSNISMWFTGSIRYGFAYFLYHLAPMFGYNIWVEGVGGAGFTKTGLVTNRDCTVMGQYNYAKQSLSDNADVARKFFDIIICSAGANDGFMNFTNDRDAIIKGFMAKLIMDDPSITEVSATADDWESLTQTTRTAITTLKTIISENPHCKLFLCNNSPVGYKNAEAFTPSQNRYMTHRPLWRDTTLATFCDIFNAKIVDFGRGSSWRIWIERPDSTNGYYSKYSTDSIHANTLYGGWDFFKVAWNEIIRSFDTNVFGE